MRIATWNINGVKARISGVLTWLSQTSPDVACLQEIKSQDEGFPAGPIEELGYNVAMHGQKGFNGVAILSKHPFDEINARLPGDDDDDHARYLEVVIPAGGTIVRVASINLPNGNPMPGPKFDYKLAWMERLESHAKTLLMQEEPLILAGDYNVIPEDEDVYDPEAWRDDALFQPETRGALRTLHNLGLTDAYRACHTEPHKYTFWDYQAGAWQKDNGIRIDHLLLSPQAADRLAHCEIDRFTRGWEKPSDHVPVWVELNV